MIKRFMTYLCMAAYLIMSLSSHIECSLKEDKSCSSSIPETNYESSTLDSVQKFISDQYTNSWASVKNYFSTENIISSQNTQDILNLTSTDALNDDPFGIKDQIENFFATSSLASNIISNMWSMASSNSWNFFQNLMGDSTDEAEIIENLNPSENATFTEYNLKLAIRPRVEHKFRLNSTIIYNYDLINSLGEMPIPIQIQENSPLSFRLTIYTQHALQFKNKLDNLIDWVVSPFSNLFFSNEQIMVLRSFETNFEVQEDRLNIQFSPGDTASTILKTFLQNIEDKLTMNATIFAQSTINLKTSFTELIIKSIYGNYFKIINEGSSFSLYLKTNAGKKIVEFLESFDHSMFKQATSIITKLEKIPINLNLELEELPLQFLSNDTKFFDIFRKYFQGAANDFMSNIINNIFAFLIGDESINFTLNLKLFSLISEIHVTSV